MSECQPSGTHTYQLGVGEQNGPGYDVATLDSLVRRKLWRSRRKRSIRENFQFIQVGRNWNQAVVGLFNNPCLGCTMYLLTARPSANCPLCDAYMVIDRITIGSAWMHVCDTFTEHSIMLTTQNTQKLIIFTWSIHLFRLIFGDNILPIVCYLLRYLSPWIISKL